MAGFIWLAAALILGIIEVLSVDLFFIMLAISAAGGAATAFLGFNLAGQVGVFSVLAIILLFLVRPWAKRVLLSSNPNIHTNAQALVGRKARVVEPVDHASGRIRLEGEIWSARSIDAAPLPVDARVIVVEIDGATAVVTATTA